ncbi:hypothetical protein C8R46DRAFT_1024647 [Mycena filopes]|nr:hypothetical protein C8R46DRAFT_1024647 [Mycena filopes]
MFALYLLCSTVWGAALAKPTNYTLDDASPSVQYGNTPILRCSPNTCPESWTSQLFNGTSTLTQSSIVVPFTGGASYTYSSSFRADDIDGDTVGQFDNSPGNGNIQLAYHNTSIPAGTHRLLILPAEPETLIEFDYIIYATEVKTPARKVPVGVIVGSVFGAVAVVAAVIVALLCLRKKQIRRKVFVRGVPLGDDDKSSINIKMIPR